MRPGISARTIPSPSTSTYYLANCNYRKTYTHRYRSHLHSTAKALNIPQRGALFLTFPLLEVFAKTAVEHGLFRTMQAATTKFPTNEYLFSIKKRSSPSCSNCLTIDTFDHYLNDCDKYKNERDKLLKDTGLLPPLRLQDFINLYPPLEESIRKLRALDTYLVLTKGLPKN